LIINFILSELQPRASEN